MRHALARCALLVAFLELSGCAVYSPSDSQPPPVETPAGEEVEQAGSPSRVTTPVPAVKEPGASAAYAPLLAQAEEAAQRGDYERALALQERAQRIDPDSPDIYLAMARTHERRGDFARARATAERGLLYCDAPDECAALRRYVH